MRTSRQGGEFTNDRIRFYRTEAMVFVSLALLAWMGSRYINLPLVGLVILAILIGCFKASFARWGNWYVGKRGELAVTDALKSLPDDYVLLNDLTLPDGRGNVDHLLIGPNSLFVIETKNYSGNVKCLGDQWFVNGWRIKSLSLQAKRHGIAVHRNLRRLFSERRQKLPFVVALLVFVKHRTQLNLEQPTLPVLKAEELVEFLRRYSSGYTIEPETTRLIVRHLQTLHSEGAKQENRLENFSIGSTHNAAATAVNKDRWTF